MLRGLEVENFTVFASANFRFGELNVIHGENSTGKTHVLKLAYSALSALTPGPNEAAPGKPTKGWLEARVGGKLAGVFRPDNGKIGRLARRVQGTRTAHVRATLRGGSSLGFAISTRSDRAVKVSSVPDSWLERPPAFLPTRELLSVYPGFVSLYETQAIPFDETWRDTCLLLGSPVSRGPKKREIANLLAPLEAAIGCKAILTGDRFFLQMTSPNARVEADLVAEGFRKMSMVARLIANGSLDDRGYLFWDEPEANLNPRLTKRLAPLLVDLATGGVQVFIATHSLFLMREIEIVQAMRKKRARTSYIGLSLGQDGVEVQQGPTVDDSGDIAALDENLEQSDRFLALG